MTTPPIYELEDLHIDFVSLVDDPANPPATVKLFKRNSGEPATPDKSEDAETSTFMKVLRRLMKHAAAEGHPDAGGAGETPIGQHMPDTPKPETPTTPDGAVALAKMSERLDALTRTLETAAAAAATREQELLNRIATIEKRNQADAAAGEAVTLTKGLPVQSGDVQAIMAQLDDAGKQIVRGILGKFRGCVRHGRVVGTIGKSATEVETDQGEIDAQELLKTEVQKMRSENPKLTEAQAHTAVLAANPGLYDLLDHTQTAEG